MDKPQGHYAMRNKPVTKRQVLYDTTSMRCLVKFRDRTSMVVTKAGGKKGNEKLFNGYRVVLQDEKNSGDWLHKVNVLNAKELYTQKQLR